MRGSSAVTGLPGASSRLPGAPVAMPASRAVPSAMPQAAGRRRLVVSGVAVPSKPPAMRPAKRSAVEIIKEKSDYLVSGFNIIRVGRSREGGPQGTGW